MMTLLPRTPRRMIAFPLFDITKQQKVDKSKCVDLKVAG
jgi:hypothetical protein